jgi:FkbM family methyltransferase
MPNEENPAHARRCAKGRVSPIKILWHSVAPWAGSGYGQQTAQAVPRIKALGHDVAISAYYGLAGGAMQWRGIKVLPSYAKSYGTDTIVPHAISHFGGAGATGADVHKIANAGLIITLCDVWTAQAPLLPDMNVAAWIPIDHETVPPLVQDWLIQTGAIPIAMSRFGETKLADIGMSPLYVPHAVDTSVFRPGDKAEARARVGLPEDAFVVAMVAANIGKYPCRKAFYEQIIAFGQLRRKHPDAVLALHTDVTNPLGVDIRQLLADFPEDSYLITDQYAYRVSVDASTVADIYRSADVLSNTSYGEGFGVPIVEAQACGTPVIVTDTTAMPELVGAGWKVPGEPLWDEGQSAWARKPLIGGIIDAYEQAYDQARDDDMRARAWAFAQDYDADRVLVEYWEPALKQLESAVERRREDAAKPRPVQPKVREGDGLLWLDRGRGYGDNLGSAGHEADLGPIMRDLLPEGGVFLDVGAHVGHWALRLADKASHVYAVEANPETAAVLRRNIALNDIGNVTVLQFAAWDEHTWLRLDDPNHEVSGGSTRTVEASDSDGLDVSVQAGPLDRELFDLDRLDLVKLDVEGADLHAIRGMAGLLAAHRPALFIEDHSIYGYYERADLEALLAELGYTWEVAHQYGTNWHPDGTRLQPVRADYLVCRPVDGG